jgi:hypothetical protein
MKLTEAKLKELIKEVMTEAAKGPADLPDGVYIVAEKTSEAYVISYRTEEGKSVKDDFGFKGTVVMGEPQLASEYPCQGALMISWSSASHGFGPLLYDVAMEIATLHAGGLVSDRTDVSWYNSDGSDGGAEEIWKYYLNNRSGKGGDVVVSQLDDEDNTLTDPTQDNCLQNSSNRAAKRLGISWKDHPLSKRYTKQPDTLKALGNKLRTIGFELNLGNEETEQKDLTN